MAGGRGAGDGGEVKDIKSATDSQMTVLEISDKSATELNSVTHLLHIRRICESVADHLRHVCDGAECHPCILN